MRRVPVACAWLTVLGLGCASSAAAPRPTTVTSTAAVDVPWSSQPAPWQGPAADAANVTSREPATAALRALRGRTPLVYVERGGSFSGASYQPVYELVVYDDGTVVYEGHRCVKLGGLILVRLPSDAVARLKEGLTTSCTNMTNAQADELCTSDRSNLRLTCSNGRELVRASGGCGGESDRRLADLAASIADDVGVSVWLGEPTERQACDASGRNLAPGEIARLVPSDFRS
jgi:hypothetical protein